MTRTEWPSRATRPRPWAPNGVTTSATDETRARRAARSVTAWRTTGALDATPAGVWNRTSSAEWKGKAASSTRVPWPDWPLPICASVRWRWLTAAPKSDAPTTSASQASIVDLR